MINVTQKAKVHLREILENQDSDPVSCAQMAVRLVREEQSGEGPSGFAITIDEPREGDQVVEHEERKVLVADPAVAEAMTDLTIDVVETEGRRRLTLTNV